MAPAAFPVKLNAVVRFTDKAPFHTTLLESTLLDATNCGVAAMLTSPGKII